MHVTDAIGAVWQNPPMASTDAAGSVARSSALWPRLAPWLSGA
jgi:hypothetical protein